MSDYIELNRKELEEVCKIENCSPEEGRKFFYKMADGKLCCTYPGYIWLMDKTFGKGLWSAQTQIPTMEEINSYKEMLGFPVGSFCLSKAVVHLPNNPHPFQNIAVSHVGNYPGFESFEAKYRAECTATRSLRRAFEMVLNRGYLMPEELDMAPAGSPPNPRPDNGTIPIKNLIKNIDEFFNDELKASARSLFSTWLSNRNFTVPKMTDNYNTISEQLQFLSDQLGARAEPIIRGFQLWLTPEIKEFLRLKVSKDRLLGQDKEFSTEFNLFLSAELNIPVHEFSRLYQYPGKVRDGHIIINQLNHYNEINSSLASSIVSICKNHQIKFKYIENYFAKSMMTKESVGQVFKNLILRLQNKDEFCKDFQ